ncbi:MAG: tRNA preQ1(34) S-adenosylmethionine ribosyltransferase-isomerase QueA [bacterium]|nr:tRNA preQ1(34) S-adenosylmethionine ribosyltransferase-isomerase QueA [bacterium]MBU1918409.1 tRNA preQ1(34) S-adenosylmethionine ribosyltransferase-isomerase QueA [bacterium]
MSHHLKDYHYDLPKELIAKYPANKRENSRLLILDRHSGKTQHQTFKNIIDHFQSGDVLVFNNSKVFPCRLITKRKHGGRQEILLIHRIKDMGLKAQGLRRKDIWKVIINAGRKVRQGDVFEFDNFTITFLDNDGSERTVQIDYTGNLFEHLEQEAKIPLPPYMARDSEELDKERYQTIYAKQAGSTAAPTAGLHFTTGLIEQLKEKGVLITELTLHVGPGTFLPVRVNNVEDHKMHTEYFTIPQETCDIINQAKKEGRCITAVGTTSTRVLEAVGYPLQPQSSATNIFIYPPHDFKIIDRLITNFHLPESTLLMLVSAFANRETILTAYKEAIEMKYRLFSYGDCMLIS